jgi:hypothetical protein
MYMMTAEQSAAVVNIPVTPEEQARLVQGAAWAKTGIAYAFEHGTRPSTISLTLSTNPLAMLAWRVRPSPKLHFAAMFRLIIYVQDGGEVHRME